MDIINGRVNESKTSEDEQFFDNICNNVTTGMSLAHDTVNHILCLNEELARHAIPTSLQLHLTLASSKLQRNFLAVRMQVEELLRLTRLYSVSWEKKNQSLRVLHKQYSSKQTKLDIALKKIELLSSLNENLKRQRIHSNWEKMFLRLTQNNTIDTGWKQRIQLYNQRLSEGKSVADMFRNLDTPECDDRLNQIRPPADHSSVNPTADLDLSQSIGGFSSINDSAFDKFSDFSGNGEEDELNFQSSAEEKSVLDWVSQNDISGSFTTNRTTNHVDRDKLDKAIQAFADEATSTKVDKDVQVGPITTDKASTTNHIQYVSTLHVKVSRPNCLRRFGDLKCTIALDNSVCKINVRGNLDDSSSEGTNTPNDRFSHEEFQYKFCYSDGNDAILESDEFQSGKLRLAFQLADNNSMLAFCSSPLSELNIPLTSLEPFAGESELTLLSTINNEEFKFNQPCGTFHVLCYISQELLEPFVDRTTQTPTMVEFINALEAHRVERCKSACVETEEKPVYTEEDLDSLRNDLNTKLEHLQAEYEEKINTLVLSHNSLLESTTNHRKSITAPPSSAAANTSTSYNNDKNSNIANTKHLSNNSTKYASKPEHPKPLVKLKFSEKWGKGLPDGFLERLNMFNDASQKYHEGLKSKTKENIDSEITKRLRAENKLSKRRHNESVFSRDVCLPAIFMPIKNSRNSCRSARSYYNPDAIPHAVPQLSLLNKLPNNIVSHSQDTN